MSDEEYVATLLAILTDPAPSGIDPADPYRQADDGIDRYDGFGRDVRVVDLGVVDGRYGDELEVSFVLSLPVGDPEWDGVPEHGSTRVPFDAEWRRLSGFDDPAAYAPVVALRVELAGRDHAVRHQHGGRPARRRDEWRAAARAALPEREAQRHLLLQTLAGEGDVTQVASDRFDLRLRDAAGDPAESVGGPVALDATPEIITFVLTPDEWEEVLVDQYRADLWLHLAETLADPDPDERFVVFYDGSLHRSTREQLPPVRGRAHERARARWRSEHPQRPGDGWFAFDPNNRDRRADPDRRARGTLTSVSDEEQVLEAAQARATALANGDAAALNDLLDERFRWTTHVGEVMDRTEYVTRNTGGHTVWRSQSLSNPRVVVVGDTAVLHAVVTDVVLSGDTESEEFRMPVTQVWVRASRGWRCLAGHAGPRLS